MQAKRFIIFISIFLSTFPSISFAEEPQLKPETKEAPVAEEVPEDIPQTSNSSAGSGGSGGGGGIDTTASRRSMNVPSVPVDVDPQTGSLSTGIQIEVPPGRAGIQPNLALTYNSNIRNGILGMGWTLELGSIQRSLKKGVPTYSYSSTEKFELVQQGSGQEIRYDNYAGYYRPEIESGAFSRIDHSASTDHWVMTDRKGTKYYFGQTNASKEFDPNQTSRVFRWCLDRVEDVHGNFMTIDYTPDNNKLYPQFIRYTDHPDTSISSHAEVEFVLEPRNRPFLSYMSGFAISTNKRISEILVKIPSFGVNGLQRKYRFQYRIGQATKRDILQTVTIVGADGQSSLPAMNFIYHDNENRGFLSQGNLIVPGGGQNGGPSFTEDGGEDDNGVRLADVNGDGLLDLIWADGAGERGTWLNNGQTFVRTQNHLWEVPGGGSNGGPSFTEDDGASDNGVRLADVDGDGLVDLMWADGSAERGTYLNDGQGNFVSDPGWLIPPGMNQPCFTRCDGLSDGEGDNGVRLADVNGDGLVDILWANGSQSSTVRQRGTWLNDGANFVPDPRWQIQQNAGFTDDGESGGDNGVQLADVNGDGLVDLMWADGSAERGTWLNDGQSFVSDLRWRVPSGLNQPCFTECDSRNNGEGDNGVRLGDVNGDGLVDIVWADGAQTTTGQQRGVWLNDGIGSFEQIPATSPWQVPQNAGFTDSAEDEGDNAVQLADVNGDGLADLIWADGAGERGTWFNDNKTFDLLSETDNGIGGRTRIEYKPSTQYQNTLLPFPIPTVMAVTQFEPISNQNYTTSYEYREGYWAPEREFRGFGYVKIIDPDGNYAVTRFHQDNIKKGRIQRQESFDAVNNPLGKTENDWGTQALVNSTFVFLRKVDNFVYKTSTAGKRTRQEFIYSGTYGDLTQTIQWGEVDWDTGADIGSDKRSVETQYVTNVSGAYWLLGLPHTVTVKDNAGASVRETYFYYDGATSLTAPPVKGLLSKKEDWAGVGQTDPVTEYTYDIYGNLKTTQDPLLNVTTINYDTAYQIFPVETRNAINPNPHRVINTYYGVGTEPLTNGLWGQLKRSTDPNDQFALKKYDVFGRPIAVIGPLDSEQYPTSTVSYDFQPQYMKITSQSRVEAGQPATLDSTSFYDGLGRLIQSKSPSETAGQYIVSGLTEYNSRGLPAKQYLSFFSTNPVSTIESVPQNTPFSEIQYDALGRPAETFNTDRARSNVVYEDWTTTTFDENGHMQKSYSDSYGRLIKKEEYLGADGRSPHYILTSGPVNGIYTLYAATLYSYDSEGNLLTVVDAHGNTTTVTYDKLGRKQTMDDPDMGVWSYGYDLNGNLKWQIDAKGQRLDFDYDVLNRLRNKRDTAAMNVDYTYDDPLRNFPKGRLTKAQYAGTNKTEFNYDALGREVWSKKAIDQYNYEVTRSYDALSRLKDVVYPDAAQVSYTYNPAGAIETVVKAGGTSTQTQDFTTFTEVDQYSTVSKTASCITYTNETSQNANSFVYKDIGIQPANFTHTVEGKVTNANNPSGEILAWGLSDEGNDTFEDWSNGIYVGFYRGTTSWNVRLRLGQTISNVQTQLDESINLAIGTNYYLKVIKAGSAMTVQIYSNSAMTNLVDTLTGNVTADQSNLHYAYGYSARTTGAWSRYMSGQTCNLKLIVNSGNTNIVSNVDYNAQGQILQINYGNGVVTIYSYDPVSTRLTRIFTRDASLTTLQDLNYTYDSVGQILAIVDNSPAGTADQTFQYDALNRLISANGQYCNGGNCTKMFQYDEIGNIIQKDGLTYTYGEVETFCQVAPGNQCYTVRYAGPHAVTALSDGTTFNYDANGNMITKVKNAVTTQYTYDKENRLTSVVRNSATVAQYIYDGDGGRQKKVTPAATTRYVGSLYEDETGGASRTTSYIFLGGTRVASVTGSTIMFYHTDHLGGTNILTDSGGVKKELIEYKPFGEYSRREMYGSSQEVARFYFTGKPLDDETGLYYYGARYYDPSLARFITPDTIVPYPNNPQALNRYSYAGNNPVSHLEDGHGWGKWWKKAWNNFVQAIRHPFDIKGQWNNLVGEANQPGIAPIASAVITVASFMFMQPELMFTTAMWTSTAASAGSAAFLESPAGQNLTDWTASNIYDNVLGMRPGTARIWASIDLGMTSSYLIERSIANIIADPVQKVRFDSNKHTIEGDSYQGKMFGPNPSEGRFKTNELWALTQNGRQIGTVGEARVGALGLDGPLSFLQIDHTGINLRGLKNAAKINPYAYLTSGVCHTGTNISLLNAGFSSTVTSLNVGGWSTYLSTAVYGNYGGGLYRSAFNGYNSDYRGRDR